MYTIAARSLAVYHSRRSLENHSVWRSVTKFYPLYTDFRLLTPNTTASLPSLATSHRVRTLVHCTVFAVSMLASPLPQDPLLLYKVIFRYRYVLHTTERRSTSFASPNFTVHPVRFTVLFAVPTFRWLLDRHRTPRNNLAMEAVHMHRQHLQIRTHRRPLLPTPTHHRRLRTLMHHRLLRAHIHQQHQPTPTHHRRLRTHTPRSTRRCPLHRRQWAPGTRRTVPRIPLAPTAPHPPSKQHRSAAVVLLLSGRRHLRSTAQQACAVR